MPNVHEEVVLGRKLCYLSLRAKTPDGLTVAVQDWATDNRPRESELLLVHGFSQSHRAWFHQVSGSLAKRFRLVTFDLRGHGDSDKPDDAACYKEAARWAGEIQSVIQTSGLDRPILVAWSYGGRVALDYLSSHGDAGISGLVMVSATSTNTPNVLGPASETLRRMTSPDPATAREGTLALLRSCLARAASASEVEYMLKYNEQVPVSVRSHLAGRPALYEHTLRAVRVPTLVIHGMLDPINLPEMAGYTAEMVPHARALTYEDAGHMPFWERPERFDEDVTSFVRKDVLGNLGAAPQFGRNP